MEDIILRITCSLRVQKKIPRNSWQETCVGKMKIAKWKRNHPAKSHWHRIASHYIYTMSKKKSNYISLACNLIHLRMLTKMLTYKTFLISFHCAWLPFFTIIRATTHMISSCCFSLHTLLRYSYFFLSYRFLRNCECACV